MYVVQKLPARTNPLVNIAEMLQAAFRFLAQFSFIFVTFFFFLLIITLIRCKDGVCNTVEENSSVFFLIRMR